MHIGMTVQVQHLIEYGLQEKQDSGVNFGILQLHIEKHFVKL
jgi:hypothetical protein